MIPSAMHRMRLVATALAAGLATVSPLRPGLRAQERPTLFGPTVAMAGSGGSAAFLWGARLEAPIGQPGGVGVWGSVAKPLEVALLEASLGLVVPEARRGVSSPYVVAGLSTLSVFDGRRANGTGVAAVGATFGVGLRLWFGPSALMSVGLRRSALVEGWTVMECAFTLAGR